MPLPVAPSHCPQWHPHSFQSCVCFPFTMSTFAFYSFHFHCPDRPVHSGSWQHTCSRLSQHGLLPSTRFHHRQITVILQPTTALLRLWSINCTMTSHLGTSSAAGCSTPEHFLFPVKNPFPAPVQDINTYCTQTYFQENIFTSEIPFLVFFSLLQYFLDPALSGRVSLKTLPAIPHSKLGGSAL